MTRDAIEKAAADAFHSVAGGTCQFARFDELLEIQKQTWRDGAKAAILAFLAAAEEPSNQMIMAALQAGLDFMKEKGVDGLSPWQDYPKPSESIKVCWRAQVSALRREIESGESA